MKQTAKIWTVVDLLKWGEDYFSGYGLDSPRLNMELLLCHLLGMGRLDLYMAHDKPLGPEELATLRTLVKRRATGEPIQYITGEAEFMGIKLRVGKGVLAPRPETELLADMVISDNQDREGIRLIDVGTGSGCLAIAMARGLKKPIVDAIDISKEALVIAKDNADNYGADINFYCLDVLNEQIMKKYDIFLSNPPYIDKAEYARLDKTVAEWEPEAALTDGGDGLAFYRRYAEIMRDVIRPGGQFYLEFGWGQGPEIGKIFAVYRHELVNDMAGIPRIIRGWLD